MQADRSTVHRASSPEPAALIELRALQDMCRLRGHRIDVQDEMIAVPRAGASALALENAGMRLEIARLLARHGATPQLLLDLELTRDRSAPGRARAAIAEALRTRVPSDALERIVLVASELVNHSALRGDARAGDRLCLRAEASQVVVHVELEDPAPGAAIPPGVTDMADLRGLGLAIVHALSQRWGADLAEAGGTRFWAQLALDTLEVQGRYD
jgi:hypothetical protein